MVAAAWCIAHRKGSHPIGAVLFVPCVHSRLDVFSPQYETVDQISLSCKAAEMGLFILKLPCEYNQSCRSLSGEVRALFVSISMLTEPVGHAVSFPSEWAFRVVAFLIVGNERIWVIDLQIIGTGVVDILRLAYDGAKQVTSHRDWRRFV